MEKNTLIYGKNAVTEALLSGSRTFNRILILNTCRSDEKIEKIKELAQKNGVVYQFVNKEKLSQLVPDTKHQGIVAQISPIKYEELDDFIERSKNKTAKVIILDGVEDSQNLGAIIRSAVCAGFDAVILPSRRGVLINPTADKTSAGAINHISIIKTNSLVNAVQQLKKSDFWIIAADHHAKDNYYDIDYTNTNLCLILGAEHAGISKSLLKLSDYNVKIPMLTDFNSLNVSNAAAIIMFEIVRQNLKQAFDNKKRG